MDPEDINKITEKIKESMTESIKTIAAQAATEAINASSSKMEKEKTSINRKRKADSVTFNKKAHEYQYHHNQEIDEKLDDALEALEERDFGAVKKH